MVSSVVLAGCLTVGTSPPQRNELQDIAALEPVLPVLAKYGVRVFHKQDWCSKFDNKRGRFSNHQTTTCAWYEGDQLFDEQAERDFQAVADALSATGVPVQRTYAKFEETGNVRYAEFHMPCAWCRIRYVYTPHPTDLPGEAPGELWHRYLKGAWWVTNEDWN